MAFLRFCSEPLTQVLKLELRDFGLGQGTSHPVRFVALGPFLKDEMSPKRVLRLIYHIGIHSMWV